jgi:WD40 repeat protein
MKISRLFFSFFVGFVFWGSNSFCGLDNKVPATRPIVYACYHQIDCLVTIENGEKIDFLKLSDGAFLGSIKCKGFGPEVNINCIEQINEKKLCAGLSDGSIWIISIPDGKLTEIQASCSNAIIALRYIGKNQILVAYKDGLVSLFGLKTKKTEFSTLFSTQTIIGMEKLSNKDDSEIVICSTSGMFIWCYIDKYQLSVLSKEDQQIFSSLSKINDTVFLVGFTDGSFCRCNIKEKTAILYSLKKGHTAPVVSLFLCNDKVFSASSDRIVKTWVFKEFECKKTLNLSEKKDENVEQCENSQDENDDEPMNDIFNFDIDEN